MWIVAGAISLAAIGTGARAASEPDEAHPGDGVAEMAALIKERAAQVDPARLIFIVNDRRADLLEQKLRQLPPGAPLADRLDLQFALALELLNAGRIDDSLAALSAVQADLTDYEPARWEQVRTRVLLQRAVAYLRMAEDQNCCRRNNKDSCLMPIKGEGVHVKREGAEHAVATLLEVLARTPGDLTARWLLNVAHMTLGTYPAGVPARYRIAPSTFASPYPLPAFTNIAAEAGVASYGISGGAILEDFDNDGRLDLMVSHSGFFDQMQLFRNRGDGTFEDRTAKAGLVGETGGLNMIQADFDNDGFVDVLVLRGAWMGDDGRFPMSLLRNNGDGTFSDVTVRAGLLRFAPSQTAAWLDYDGDGWLDLFVGNESQPGAGRYPCQLFHNNHDGTFTDVAPQVGVDVVGFVKGVTSGDYDNDGRPDLYVSLLGGSNLLFHNDGPIGGSGPRPVSHFTEVAARAGVQEPRSSFGTFFFDYDNDGWLDLFVTGYGSTGAESQAADDLGLPTAAERQRLYHNEGNGTFKDVTREAGLYHVIPTMGHNFGDLDNDGYLDIYLGTGNPDLSTLVPNRMFRNDGGRCFQDVTTAGNFGHLQKGHAIAFGDVDNDGDQDVFAQMGGAYTADKAFSALYENPGNANGWIGIELAGVRSNRRGIGARIKLTLEMPRGPRAVYRTVGSGGSFGGNPLRQQIGVGDAARVTSVEVFWPATGVTQRVSGLELDRWYEIREDGATAQPLVRPPSTPRKPQPGTGTTTVASIERHHERIRRPGEP